MRVPDVIVTHDSTTMAWLQALAILTAQRGAEKRKNVLRMRHLNRGAVMRFCEISKKYSDHYHSTST